MTSKGIVRVIVAVGFGSFLCHPLPAAPLNTKDVSTFDYSWDFQEAPGDPADAMAVFDTYNNSNGSAGGDGVPDFHRNAGAQPVHSGGILTTNNGTNVFNDIFKVAGITVASGPMGYTAEYRVRASNTVPGERGVASYDAPLDKVGAAGWRIVVNPTTGLQEVYYGAINENSPADAAVPGNDFITIREAVEYQPGNFHDMKYTLYVNGLPVAVDQSGTFANSGIAGRFIFGDLGSGFSGTLEVDSVAFTPGAFAPIPEPASMGLLTLGSLALLRRRRQQGRPAESFAQRG